MFFKYKGVKNGQIIRAALEGESFEEARRKLRQEGIMVIELTEAVGTGRSTLRPRSKIERRLSGIFISGSELENAVRQLVILLNGYIPVVEALDVASEFSKGMLAQALNETAADIRNGSSLAKAMRRHMPFLGELALGLIAVGEANGALPEMFMHCRELLEQKRKIRSKLIQSMIYPVIVLLMGVGVGYYVTAVAIPKLAQVLEGDTAQLPAVTRALLGTSDWVIHHGGWIIIAPLVAFGSGFILRKCRYGAVLIDHLVLRLPLFGKVFKFAANSLWNRNLSTLIQSGMNVVESLELTMNTMVNSCYRRQFQTVIDLIRDGKTLTYGMRHSTLSKLSPMSMPLISAGEKSGHIDSGLKYVSEYYEDALNRRLDLIGKLVEPALIVVIGGMVAFVYVGFFMGMAATSTTL